MQKTVNAAVCREVVMKGTVLTTISPVDNICRPKVIPDSNGPKVCLLPSSHLIVVNNSCSYQVR